MKNILIIDDTVTMAKMISLYLTENGFNTIIAHDGKSGVEKYALHAPDLVLLDIEMPEMNGFETLKEIKNVTTSSPSPVIMLTSRNTKNAIFQAIKEGAADYIVKPVNTETLIAKVNKNLKKAV